MTKEEALEIILINTKRLSLQIKKDLIERPYVQYIHLIINLRKNILRFYNEYIKDKRLINLLEILNIKDLNLLSNELMSFYKKYYGK